MAFQTPVYPGIKLDDNYGPELNAVAISFTVISAVAIALRLISRYVNKLPIKSDDWLVFASAILSWAYSAIIIVEADRNFYGQHIGKSDPEHLQQFLKGLFALAIIYPIALTTSKLSLLVLLWRIFHVGSAKIPIIVAASLNVAWMVAAVLVGIFSCSPVDGFWRQDIESTCIQEYNFFVANECLTMFLDLVVLLMPIYFISSLQQSLSQRISISITFLLGLVATVVSAIRLWQLVEAQKRPGNDPTFNETGAGLWAIVELNVWIVVATIPALRLLFRKTVEGIRRVRSRSRDTSPSSSDSYYSPSSSSSRSKLRSRWHNRRSNRSNRSRSRSQSLSSMRNSIHTDTNNRAGGNFRFPVSTPYRSRFRRYLGEETDRHHNHSRANNNNLDPETGEVVQLPPPEAAGRGHVHGNVHDMWEVRTGSGGSGSSTQPLTQNSGGESPGSSWQYDERGRHGRT